MSFSQYILFCFKFISVSIAFAMAGYCIHKYAKNEDNTMIEYKTFRDSDSIYLPAMSICFVNPFSSGNGPFRNNNGSRYGGFLRYLQGMEEFNEKDGDILSSIKNFQTSNHLDKIMVFNYLTFSKLMNPYQKMKQDEGCYPGGKQPTYGNQILLW